MAVLAYDLLEWQGDDWRQREHRERRVQLEAVVGQCPSPQLMLSPLVSGRIGRIWPASAKPHARWAWKA